MDLKSTLCTTFAVLTFMILAGICLFKYEYIDMNSIISMMYRIVPATIVMGLLGRMMGAILDKPKNLADSDYQTDVLQALKKMDKNMTMSELSKKLSPIPEIKPEDIQVQTPENENTEENEQKPE